MMITFTILVIAISTIIIHILIIKKGKKKFNPLAINSKLSKKDFTKSDKFSIDDLTEKNKNYKILIVEDDFVNRKLLTAQLTAAKYSVITAENGEQALNLITKQKDIDIVLLDLILPDISGFTICKKIRESYTLYQKPVIMVTSKNYIKDLIDGFEAGANDFITKPYNIYELIARINSSISLKNMFEDNSSLKKINKLKSDIVDMAAHDLKSPLTLISGYATRNLKSITPGSKESANTNKILDSSNKMLSIIDNLLNDSRSENKILNFVDLNVCDIINLSIEFYSDMANNKNQKVNFYYYNPEILLHIDKISFTTIVDNLLSNAIKFSPVNSHINIKIKEENKNIILSFNDCGNGFTQDEIDNLFIKFFPFTNKPTQGENSTGLGLYIIQDMVTKNNGSISVTSTRGKGSEFKLTFLKS
ncbi:MAG: hybrid sensor histidine kinase/response regulator [Spirochaetaceae bacterium]